MIIKYEVFVLNTIWIRTTCELNSETEFTIKIVLGTTRERKSRIRKTDRLIGLEKKIHELIPKCEDIKVEQHVEKCNQRKFNAKILIR